MLLDEPTRGIDVGAKVAVYRLMRQLAAEGKGMLMVSSELPEVIGMSDRILVMRDGRLAGELPAGATEEEILRLGTGARVPARRPRAGIRRPSPTAGPAFRGRQHGRRDGMTTTRSAPGPPRRRRSSPASSTQIVYLVALLVLIAGSILVATTGRSFFSPGNISPS